MELPPGLQEAAPGGAAVAVGDSEKIAELLRSERGGMRLTAVGIVDEKIGDVAVKLAEDIPFAALEQHLLNPDGWQALAETLLGEPSARVGYLVKASLLKAWWEDATPEQPPTKASAPTAYTPLGRAQVRQLVPPMLQQPARRLLLREPVFARLEVEPVLQSKPQHPRGTEYLYSWALFTAFT